VIERDRAASVRRTLAAVAAIVVAVLPAAARADGDPASDYLLAQNVSLPNPAPSTSTAAALVHATGAVYAGGGRVKVAVIFGPNDLGSIPSLYGRPDDYARYLGLELSLWYEGPLVVVMPAGFGVYDGGRTTGAEEQVLRAIGVSARSTDDLTRSATAAVTALEAHHALASPDVKAPIVTTYPASAARGRPATLHLDLFDDSGRTSAVVQIYEQTSRLATLQVPLAFEIGTRTVRLRWPVPRHLRSRQLRFCVVAADPAGNRSATACAPFLQVR